MKLEEEYMDVLQNIEMMLARTYREYEEMTDWETLAALNALIRTYSAEQKGRAAPALKLKPLAQESYDAAYAMCEVRLGRGSFGTEDGEEIGFEMDTVDLPIMIACLKRIRKSVQRWQKEYGRRGYFEFVSQFGV